MGARNASARARTRAAQKTSALDETQPECSTSPELADSQVANTVGHSRVVLELEPVTDQRWSGIDPTARLRLLLKAALRSYGWRVRRVGKGAQAPIVNAGTPTESGKEQGNG